MLIGGRTTACSRIVHLRRRGLANEEAGRSARGNRYEKRIDDNDGCVFGAGVEGSTHAVARHVVVKGADGPRRGRHRDEAHLGES